MANGISMPQSPLDFLQSMYEPLGVTPEQYGQYQQFIPEIPAELYEITDPSADIYQQFRAERRGILSEQLGETYSGLQQSLFSGQRQARGMEGRRGFVTGRDFMGDVSELAGMRGQRAASAFGRGLYNIEEDIVNRVGAERRYLATLESQRRSDALRVADLAGLFDITPEERRKQAQFREEQERDFEEQEMSLTRSQEEFGY
jgi:hypothetical protein|tara:strand:- start:73 stop:678 length:606 start_codon:yes stop_codon:yes gene_type:complete